MAKGLRASSRKKNNAALRDRLFGPASDARTERLSAKLQELAAKPRPDQERAMEVDNENVQRNVDATEAKSEEMDVDAQGAKLKPVKRHSKNEKHGRIQKKVPKRKPRNSIVFADVKAKWRRQVAEKRKK